MSSAAPARKRKASAPLAARKTPSAAPAKAGRKDVKPVKTEDKTTDKKKVIRDSFTMPQDDYAKIAQLKQICLKAGIHAKKSELLRAGLHALARLSGAQLKQALARLQPIKTGRPKKANRR